MIISLGVELLQRSSNLPIPQTQIVWISANNLNLSRASFLYPEGYRWNLFGLAPRRGYLISLQHSWIRTCTFFLLPCSSPYGGRVLPATILFGVRTFLSGFSTRATIRSTFEEDFQRTMGAARRIAPTGDYRSYIILSPF